MPPRRFILLLLSACLYAAAAWAQDGIYADFATSKGNFTCQLYYDKAPWAVANFIGLATGQRAWLNGKTGEAARRPFYNGLTFHKVATGSFIQAGSPNADGKDGPGYTFRDQFDPALRHDRAGLLSMVNPGANSVFGPNGVGSIFSISLAAYPAFNDVNTIFGEVTSGMDTVNAIGAAPVDSAGKPQTPITLNSVTIRRVGAAANAFDIAAQGLPLAGGAGPKFAKVSGIPVLQFTRSLYSEYWLYNSADLSAWTRQRLGLYVAAPPSGNLDVSASANGQTRQFYRVSQVAYPGPLYTPAALSGGTLSLLFANGDQMTIAFNNAGGGTYQYVSGTATIVNMLFSYQWSQEAYRGQFYCVPAPVGGSLPPFEISVNFSSATAGAFKGLKYSGAFPAAIAGSFTFSAP